MGSTHFFHLFASPINYPPINPRYPLVSPKFYPQFLPSSFSKPNRRTTSDTIRRRIFDFDDDFRGEKRRNWWSDDDDSDSDDEDDEGFEFGFFEDSNPFDWIFQALKIFGWVVPAVIISNLLGGTGTNSLMMAVVLPLGQTALSLVMDKLGGSAASSSSSRTGYKSRRRPRPRSRSRPGARKARSRTSPGSGGYQSWRTANSSSVKKGVESDPRFGGWDELDEQVEPTSSFSSKGQSREVRRQNLEIGSGKLSRRRNRDKPLLMRYLIAVFPLLGSWTRFLL
ncbi:uncharacterized protein LOC141657625 [Silene latifolia]|uniref:uncharacterized protein LOC141657625 n=1 Tax=Silene latifolia TaxID=37657 RepID=UPI003D77312F